jgi:hypothetical protein
MHWNKQQLPKKIHSFAGDYHGFQGEFLSYKFKPAPVLGDAMEMQMAPPLAGNKSVSVLVATI